jgi:TAT (twin-arginine translocation) pathway signal sequence
VETWTGHIANPGSYHNVDKLDALVRPFRKHDGECCGDRRRQPNGSWGGYQCILCDRGKLQLHSPSRRNFLKGTAATGLAAGAVALFGPSAEAQGHNVNPPPHTGSPGRRYVIRNGYVMTMEPGTPGANSSFGEFIEGDVLFEGKTIKAIGRNL